MFSGPHQFAGLLPSGRKNAKAQGWRLRDENLYIRKALLDALSLTCRNLTVPKLLSNIKATMTSMGMYYPASGLLTAIIGFDAVTAVYIRIGVGFGVARFDNRAMTEPLQVGRVTGRFPRFFYV